MSLIDYCERDFGTKSLYGVLGVKETATAKELQQAYRKISLFLLPAQAPAHRLEEFCRKFEIVSKVHYILSDASKRQVYDEKGVIDASVDKLGALFGTKYWKKLFPHIVPEDIEDFKEIYKNSDEEKEDLKIVYLRAKGDMDRLAEIYFAYSAEDEDRICDTMLGLIKRKEMPSYAKFMKEGTASIEARKKKYKRPNSEDDPTSINPIVLFLRNNRKNLEEQREAARDEPPRRRRRRQ